MSLFKFYSRQHCLERLVLNSRVIPIGLSPRSCKINGNIINKNKIPRKKLGMTEGTRVLRFREV